MSPTLLTRRQALQRIGLALGGIATAPVLSGVLGGCRTPSGEDAASYAYQALDADQQRTLAALVDRIIPPTDTPGAAEAGVPQFIDMMLAEWYAPEERAAFLAGLAETEQRAQAEAGTAFADLDEEAQTTFVAALDAETYAAERESAEPEVDGDVAGAGQQGTYQAQEELEEDPAGTQGELGEAMSDEAAAADSSAEEPQAASGAPPFFRQLKELTLAGYYTSEVGATEELRWNAAPGRYDADVPFSEIGRAWA